MHLHPWTVYLSRSSTGDSGIEILVMPEPTRFDLNDPELVKGVDYQVKVLAENDLGLGPPSNTVTYTKVEEGKLHVHSIFIASYNYFHTSFI